MAGRSCPPLPRHCPVGGPRDLASSGPTAMSPRAACAAATSGSTAAATARVTGTAAAGALTPTSRCTRRALGAASTANAAVSAAAAAPVLNASSLCNVSTPTRSAMSPIAVRLSAEYLPTRSLSNDSRFSSEIRNCPISFSAISRMITIRTKSRQEKNSVFLLTSRPSHRKNRLWTGSPLQHRL